jgi:hypothetical protein
MKFASTILMSLLASAAAAPSRATRGLLSKARKLEDQNNNGEDQAEEEEYAFLQNYQLKLVSCKAGEQIRDPETGELDYNAAIFRLCPADDCSEDRQTGCYGGHGDYVVGLQSFVQAYFEDQRDNMYFDDAFNVMEYAECREYEMENDDGNQNENAYPYYIGPACTEDGKGVRLELFYDEACSMVPEEVTFEDISNGWALPYEEGGLVSENCQPCSEYNQDDGGYELKEMCMGLYEEAGKCETNMESYHYYGKQEGSCEYIAALMPSTKGSGSGAKAFGWVVFILVVVGAFSAYAMWWKKKKSTQAADGLMA